MNEIYNLNKRCVLFVKDSYVNILCTYFPAMDTHF